MNRKKLIGFKVSDWENSQIRAKAKRSRLTLSNYVRTTAMGKQITVINGLEQWLPELNRIGNNINQITVILHTRQVQNPEFSILKQDFKRLVDIVATTLQERQQHGNYQDDQRKVG